MAVPHFLSITPIPKPDRLIQIWEFFLAYSTIISRQGSATCFQITLVKNLNSTHRVEGIPTQFGLSGALAAASRPDFGAAGGQEVPNPVSGLAQKAKNVLGMDA
jgi:hypothetical protein